MQSTVALIGAEFEENLSLRYLASSIEPEGFVPLILSCNDACQAREIAVRVRACRPLVVGISIPFQHRAPELLKIAADLRATGFSGHIAVGGHFATFEYDRILRDFPAIDSVVRHEGEDTFRELCACIRDATPLHEIPGLVTRREGAVVPGDKRALAPLDDLPFPTRARTPHSVMSVACSPLLGSRGCYADCSFCCIHAYAESAHGARYRRRSPENIVREMRQEYYERGVRLFVFHDDNFFVPSHSRNLRRYRRLSMLLRAEGLNDIGLVIKCRPNDVQAELFELLKSMGLIRAYVGIETNSDEGIVSLNRRITAADNRRALETLLSLDIYSSFNVLIFEPEATLNGIERNLDFMEEFAAIPFNFCRAEVYAGTPLKRILEEQARLQGHYLAWNYEMRDPRAELLFRIATTAFRPRNFKPDGVANLNMGIRFDAEVVRHFHPECWDAAWHGQLVELSHAIGLDSVRCMREILGFARSMDIHDSENIKEFTLGIARRLARADLDFVVKIRTARRELERQLTPASRVRLRAQVDGHEDLSTVTKSHKEMRRA